MHDDGSSYEWAAIQQQRRETTEILRRVAAIEARLDRLLASDEAPPVEHYARLLHIAGGRSALYCTCTCGWSLGPVPADVAQGVLDAHMQVVGQ